MEGQTFTEDLVKKTGTDCHCNLWTLVSLTDFQSSFLLFKTFNMVWYYAWRAYLLERKLWFWVNSSSSISNKDASLALQIKWIRQLLHMHYKAFLYLPLTSLQDITRWFYQQMMNRDEFPHELRFYPGGRGGTTYHGLYREAPPQRGTFFRLPSHVEVYKWVGKSVIWVCERAQKG